jgi:hypothetical protein
MIGWEAGAKPGPNPEHPMSIAELLPPLRELNRADKLRVMQFLVDELALAETGDAGPADDYSSWSPHGDYGAAQQLTELLATRSAGSGEDG